MEGATRAVPQGVRVRRQVRLPAVRPPPPYLCNPVPPLVTSSGTVPPPCTQPRTQLCRARHACVCSCAVAQIYAAQAHAAPAAHAAHPPPNMGLRAHLYRRDQPHHAASLRVSRVPAARGRGMRGLQVSSIHTGARALLPHSVYCYCYCLRRAERRGVSRSPCSCCGTNACSTSNTTRRMLGGDGGGISESRAILDTLVPMALAWAIAAIAQHCATARGRGVRGHAWVGGTARLSLRGLSLARTARPTPAPHVFIFV